MDHSTRHLVGSNFARPAETTTPSGSELFRDPVDEAGAEGWVVGLAVLELLGEAGRLEASVPLCDGSAVGEVDRVLVALGEGTALEGGGVLATGRVLIVEAGAGGGVACSVPPDWPQPQARQASRAGSSALWVRMGVLPTIWRPVWQAHRPDVGRMCGSSR
ncbi:hypothetical protein [Luteococcus peritonei]|uniref:Uncharacterized protein n=1 Tax=Luteococcus peritonei TaxID=88874 RepID=A0ABW4RYD7_9ACTN